MSLQYFYGIPTLRIWRWIRTYSFSALKFYQLCKEKFTLGHPLVSKGHEWNRCCCWNILTRFSSHHCGNFHPWTSSYIQAICFPFSNYLRLFHHPYRSIIAVIDRKVKDVIKGAVIRKRMSLSIGREHFDFFIDCVNERPSFLTGTKILTAK